MLSPDFMEWLFNWPAQPCPMEVMALWLDECPIGRRLDGPNREVARRMKGKQKWAVYEYMAPEPNSPKKWCPVGSFSSKGLCLRWESLSLTQDLQCLQPAFTTDELHHMVCLATSDIDEDMPEAEAPPDKPDLSLPHAGVEMTFGFDKDHGVVVLDFGKHITWMGLDAVTADAFAAKLIETAALLRAAAH